MKFSTKIAKEAVIALGGMGFGDVIRYIFVASLARLVGADYLGIYSLANAVTKMFEVFGKTGLDSGILRFVSMRSRSTDEQKIRKDIRSTLKMGLIFALITMVLQILISGWLVYSVFRGSSLLKTVILVNAITLPFSILTIIAATATQGYKLVKYKIFVMRILIPFILLVSMVTTYFLFSLEMTIILPMLISSFVGFIVMLYFLKKLTFVRISQIFTEKLNFIILKFSYPLMFVAVIDTLMHWMDIMMLGYFTDTTIVGLYHPAARTASMMRAILVAIMSIAAPMLSQLFTQKKQEEMIELYQLAVRWIITLALPFIIVIVLLPNKIMLLFGGQYLPASSVLVVLTFASMVLLFTGIGGSTLTVTDHTKINLINSVIVVLVNIILDILWIPRYGIIGAAWATLVSMTMLGILRFCEVWFLIKLHPLDWKLLKPFIACFIACLALYVVKPFLMPFHTLVTLIFGVVITFSIYGWVLWILKFDSNDREIWSALVIIKRSFRPKQSR